MKYDRPVRELLAECVGQLAQPFDRSDVFAWFRANYPDVAEGTISTHIAGLTVGNRPHAHLATYPPVVERVGRGLYRRVSSSGVVSPFPPPAVRSWPGRGVPGPDAVQVPQLTAAEIEAHLSSFLARRGPEERFASFDYCFAHFQAAHDSGDLNRLVDGDGLQLSCLHLGFYLASWGMLRGSGELLRRSVRDLKPVVVAIVAEPAATWRIDADVLEDAADEVIACASRLRRAFSVPASDILVTKTLLGVFGCVPAFDRYFKAGFGASTFGPRSLRRVGRFYRDNREVLDAAAVGVLDFQSGTKTDRRYPKSKLIDMIFFERGREIESRE